MISQFKYAPSNLEFIEDLEKYCQDGFHPVYLGDKLDHVDFETYRYEVIHKLGFGGFSTVWLAHNLIDGGYVALKVVCASQGTYGATPAVKSILDSHPANIFVTEIRRFLISGPNGQHVCQVLPVTGPSLLALSAVPYRLQPAACKRLTWQAAQALEFLHKRDICHGDFTPSNLVLAVPPALHQLSKDDLLKLLGTPLRDPVYATGDKTTKSAPKYVVAPADLTKLGPSYLTDSLVVVDFDQLFGFGERPLSAGIPPNPGFNLGTPLVYLAPEVIIDGTPSPASDIWALGCSIFHMRSGHQLLDPWHFDCASNVLQDIFDVKIGPPLPQKWKKVQFRKNGWPAASPPASGTDDEIQTIAFGEDEVDPDEDLKAKVYGIWDEKQPISDEPPEVTESSIFWKIDPNVVPHWANVEGGFPHIDPEEAVQLLDLLRRIFEYDTKKRITAAEIVKHTWLGHEEDDGRGTGHAL